ncbi:MAG: PQ-loop repeat-containing protein [Proteobacteria bacterium]|nr:PQ-loop repeat-containing protein [Pseudomonadota bacterium]MBU4381594.1 PQ-loop repeat-containing protein [Pseudomonadota bacterium]MCG2766580.1 PQ-loop repeat-containing protein [Desulfarculaceae bacterium]
MTLPDHLANVAFVLGYILVVACYIPQWVRILRTRETAGISPGLLGMVTAGLILIQLAALGGAWGQLMAWGNGAALLNALITDAAYVSARKGRK